MIFSLGFTYNRTSEKRVDGEKRECSLESCYE